MRSLLAVTLLAVTLLASGGCGHSIGDPCKTNVDCSPAGDRFCDTSELGGYCTVEGCDVNTCPDGEPCIRFLTQRLDEACTYDPTRPFSRASCDANEQCICDTEAPAGGTCSAHCAPESSERRWCQHRCSTDSDCRAGYHCVTAGSGGALLVPTLNNPDPSVNASPTKFCAPSV
jgi:hypothetical protein